MSRISISYRRDDSGGWAGRLYDRLSQHFGRENVFMDIDTIEPGLDFVEVIQEAVGSCDALIAVIGRQWVTIADVAGGRRLENPEDFVRLEIAAALERNIRVIPALVHGAPMPRSTELPEVLQRFARRNALDISDARFHSDVDRLIAVLERVLAGSQPPPIPATSKASVIPSESTKKPTSDRLPFEPEMVRIPVMSEPPADAPTAFLCHEHRDKPAAESLTTQLQARGIKIWLDKQSL